MITRLHVKNFKCLWDVQVDLGPFTVLIGPNDSGKTSLLDAIQVLGATTQGQINQTYLAKLVWRGEEDQHISWQVQGTSENTSFNYTLEVSPKGPPWVQEQLQVDGQPQWEWDEKTKVVNVRVNNNLIPFRDFHPPILAALREQRPHFFNTVNGLRSTIKYRLDPEALRKPAAYPTQAETALGASGDNLVAVLDSIIRDPDGTKIWGLEQVLNEALPTLQGISLSPNGENVKSLAFKLAGTKQPPATIPASLASDGALLFTGFLVLAYADTPPLIFVEEPENGIHPFLLKIVVQLLRRISTGEIGDRPRQVILTTHSPILVNFVQPEEVRIFSRGPDGGTQVTPMKEAPNIDNLLKEFAAGELWYLLGEQALVEGKQK